jgi:membrane-associated phospholipid phosphatase
VLRRLVALAAVVVAVSRFLPAGAQPAEGPAEEEKPPSAYTKNLGRDLKDFATAPARWRGREWAQFAGVIGAIGLAYQSDTHVREHFANDGEPDYHEVEDAMPAAIAFGSTWIVAKIHDDEEARAEAVLMVRATVLGAVSTEVLKEVSGRTRPGPGVPHDDWHSGGRSFPSGHTATAFAIGTILAESGDDRHRRLRRIAGYGLVGFATAYGRLNHDAHWLSDTVAGAALGISAGRFELNRRDRSEPKGTVALLPEGDGFALTYTVPMWR